MSKELIDYFIERTDKRFDAIEKKVDKLLQFKWQIIGGAGVMSLIVTLFIQVMIK